MSKEINQRPKETEILVGCQNMVCGFLVELLSDMVFVYVFVYWFHFLIDGDRETEKEEEEEEEEEGYRY